MLWKTLIFGGLSSLAFFGISVLLDIFALSFFAEISRIISVVFVVLTVIAFLIVLFIKLFIDKDMFD